MGLAPAVRDHSAYNHTLSSLVALFKYHDAFRITVTVPYYGDSALNCSRRDHPSTGAEAFGPRLPGLSTRPVRFSMRTRKRSSPSGRPMLSAARSAANR